MEDLSFPEIRSHCIVLDETFSTFRTSQFFHHCFYGLGADPEINCRMSLSNCRRNACRSSGKSVGMMANNPEEKIALKAFCPEIINNHEELARESKELKELPQVFTVDNRQITENYLQIKKHITHLVQTEIERIIHTPELSKKIIRKE